MGPGSLNSSPPLSTNDSIPIALNIAQYLKEIIVVTKLTRTLKNNKSTFFQRHDCPSDAKVIA